MLFTTSYGLVVTFPRRTAGPNIVWELLRPFAPSMRVKTSNTDFLTMTFLCFALLVEKFLNGELDDDTKYAVFQRSFDKDDNYENEGFIIFTTNKDNTAAIVAGVVVPLIVLAIIVVVVIVYLRRRNKDQAVDGEDVPMNSKPHRTKSVSAFFRRSGIGELYCRTFGNLSEKCSQISRSEILVDDPVLFNIVGRCRLDFN